VGWTLLGLLLIALGAYVAGYLLTSDRVPRGTTVGGVDIGGMRPAAAERLLDRELAPRASAPIPVRAASERAEIDPRRAGLRVDMTESVDAAGAGRSWSPVRMWHYFAGGEDQAPVVSTDDARVRAALEPLGARVDKPARNGSIRFTADGAEPTFARPGVTLDADTAVARVQQAFVAVVGGSDQPGPVRLAVDRVDPEVDNAAVSKAMDDFANPAMSAPVRLELAATTLLLRPADYAETLSVENEGGALVPAVDDEALVEQVEPALGSADLAPQDAEVRLVDGRPRVIPAVRGVTVDRDKLPNQFLRAVAAEGEGRTITVGTAAARPDFTTAEARALNIREVVSQFTTYFPHADYRNINLGRAAELINGTVLKPGETFSLNDTVGERTAANGFTKGFIISDGVFIEDFGGGVSQVATTLFNAAFFAGLEDVEHKPHSFYIDRYPEGREATVAWGAVDLRFRNDTPHGVLIEAFVQPSSFTTQGAMTVRMWSTKHWKIRAETSERYNFTTEQVRRIDSENCEPNTGYGGFDVDVYRLFYRPGSDELVRREKMHTRYTPSDTVICL
jgi:vancomycin resistance protein YoaR